MSHYKIRNEINSQEVKKESIKININDKNNSINLNNIKKDDKNKLITDKSNKINILNKQKSFDKNETKILLYPQNKPIKEWEKISFPNYKVPLLSGFYNAHAFHYPIRLKPDDIWLLIIQAFSNHININSEELRNKLVNFEGKKKLEIDININHINIINSEYEKFIEKINDKIKSILGKEFIDILTPNFSTTNRKSIIICKISIMNALKKYFEYKMNIGLSICGIPYIILEGNANDYKEILNKINFLKKYDFDWYVNRIIPHIKKMVEAKEGNIDINYFKSFIQDKKITETKFIGGGCLPPKYRKEKKINVDYIKGWFIDFFAYYGKEKSYRRMEDSSIKIENFNNLAEQIFVVPFKMYNKDTTELTEMKFKVGFLECGKNSKDEVYPVSGWSVSKLTKQDKESFL